MKTIILVQVLTLFFITSTLCQERTLVITDKTSAQEKVFREGKKLSVKLSNGLQFRGKLNFLPNMNNTNDSIIMIGQDVIQLNEITEIKNKPLLAKITGSCLLVVGGTMCIGGFVVIFSASAGEMAALTAITGMLLTTAGLVPVVAGVLVINIKKKYKSSKYEFSIIQNQDHP